MPLATTTDTAAVTPAPLSKYEIQRNERHGASQAASNTKRRGRNAPRRDDIARIGLFLLLMQYRKSKDEALQAYLRKTVVDLHSDAGFEEAQAGVTFDKLGPSVGADLDRYLILRWIEPAIRNVWRNLNAFPVLPD
ncbi:hypothetical protein MKK68_08280 [Methylobacterium sp. E-016]|uniref:hypothetical protein n=1 Tax=Methylobacterium sp. E-016 TaxID=2836556 RepID=UPI001FB98DFC|nr:hypothetical protein [Methylobacterium sp. E-016]MCJ2075649.1 hypothetical protein [Methylobacterium sp. E-016]